ncbi:peptidase U32 family protein [Elusimicrobiota bacterium]
MVFYIIKSQRGKLSTITKKVMKKEHFKILAPFTRIEEVELFKDAGADELYCGYITEELAEKWPIAFVVLNRRGEGQSFEKYKYFKEAVNQANKYDLPVYVTINGLYTPEQYPLLLDLVSKVECLEGVKGIIVADMGLLLTLKKNKFTKEIHISTGGTCFNSSTAEFYRNLGANRIILPTDMTSSEIKNIVAENKFATDIEIFVVGGPCGGFTDGYCTFLHCLEKPVHKKIKDNIYASNYYTPEKAPTGCKFYFIEELAEGHFDVFNAASCKQKNIDLKYQPEKHNFYGSPGCRICDLYDLKKYKIKNLKISGRGFYSEEIVRRIKFVSKAVSYLTRNNITKREYKRKCKDLFSRFFLNNKRRCTKFDCYFSCHWAKYE